MRSECLFLAPVRKEGKWGENLLPSVFSNNARGRSRVVKRSSKFVTVNLVPRVLSRERKKESPGNEVALLFSRPGLFLSRKPCGRYLGNLTCVFIDLFFFVYWSLYFTLNLYLINITFHSLKLLSINKLLIDSFTEREGWNRNTIQICTVFCTMQCEHVKEFLFQCSLTHNRTLHYIKRYLYASIVR